jgi:hypothetical protein
MLGLVVAIAAFTTPAESQRPDTVAKPGAVIRMWSERMHWNAVNGTVVSWVRTDTVIVAAKILLMGKARTNRYQIPVWELDTLKMQMNAPGFSSRFERSLLWGGVVGAVVGALTGAVTMMAGDCGNATLGKCTASELAAGSGFIGLLGGLVGMAVGAFSTRFGAEGADGAWVTVVVPRPAG